MKKRLVLPGTFIMLLVSSIVFLLFSYSCGKIIRELPNRKVIITNLGEQKSNVSYLNETVYYRIYYCNSGSSVNDIRIVDKLDVGISEVQIESQGVYDDITHIAYWEIKNVPAGGKGHVDINGTLKKTGTIINFARIYFSGKGKFPEFNIKEYDLGNDNNIIASKDLKRRDFGERPIIVETDKVTTNVYDKPRIGWIPFIPESKPGDLPKEAMKDNTTIGAMINFDIPGVFVYETKQQGMPYYKFSMPGQASMTDVGKPELPILGRVIEVPFDVNFTIEVVKSKLVNLDHYRVYPAQELPYDVKKGDPLTTYLPTAFKIDNPFYLTDKMYPEALAAIQSEDIGVIRGHRIVLLKVNPIRYNPVTHLTQAYAQIEVRVRYDKPAQLKAIPKRLYSPYFEKELQHMVLNYKDQKQMGLKIPPLFAYKEWTKRQGCDYLILTTNTYYNPNDANNPVVRFANWKRQKGFVTQVTDIANITNGTTYTGIRQYLDNAYQTWNLVPSYVLLIGDADQIPVRYLTAHPSHNNTLIGTDLYYSTLDGTDIFPDIYVGRLSVDNLTQATTALDRIINYEQQPTSNANFYDSIMFVASFEDVHCSSCPSTNYECGCSDGTEDRPWIEAVEDVRNYDMSLGYLADRFYIADNPGGNQPANYQNGNALPTVLQSLGWNSTDTDVSNAVNAGRFLAYYRDHGSRDAWSATGFNNNDIDNLTNGDLVPVIFSMACQNGWFDNETDNNSLSTPNNSECFAEHFNRQQNGGTVAIIAACRNSQTGPNDFMMFGFNKAIWPDYVPNPSSSTYFPSFPVMTSNRLLEVGQIMNFGKMYMASAFSASNDRTRAFEIYHLFGDPEMPVWVTQPLNLDVSYPSTIGSTGEQDFVIKVTDHSNWTPVNSARVVLTSNNDITSMYETDPAGIARFKLNAPSGNNLDLTVTALGYIPFRNKINISSDGATINTLDPDNWITGQVIKIGGINFSDNENVDILFGGSVLKTITCSGTSFGQAGQTTVDFTVPSPYDLGPVNVTAKGKTSNRCGVDVFWVREQNPVDLYIYDQWDNSTWGLYSGTDNPTWDNPSIQLYDGATSISSYNLTVGHTYKIRATVYNNTPYLAQKAKVTFKWTNFGLGQPSDVWTVITPSPIEIDVPASGSAQADIDWTPGLTGHTCIQTEIYHIEEVNTANNVGQENCQVGPTSSPAKVEFTVWNPTRKPQMIYFDLRQIVDSLNQGHVVLWESQVIHPDPQLLQPGEKRQAAVLIDPAKSDVKSGTTVNFSLTGYANQKIIGGANFRITKK